MKSTSYYLLCLGCALLVFGIGRVSGQPPSTIKANHRCSKTANCKDLGTLPGFLDDGTPISWCELNNSQHWYKVCEPFDGTNCDEHASYSHCWGFVQTNPRTRCYVNVHDCRVP